MTILVTYSEIALKSKFVRNRLERLLISHIRFKLQQLGYVGFKVRRRYGRIVIATIPKEAAKHVASVFGVASVMPAEKTSIDIAAILNLIIDIAKKHLQDGDSFALRTRVIAQSASSVERQPHWGSALPRASAGGRSRNRPRGTIWALIY